MARYGSHRHMCLNKPMRWYEYSLIDPAASPLAAIIPRGIPLHNYKALLRLCFT